MSLETERYCPQCGGDRTFYLSASTRLHLGMKRKWSCTECDYGFVRIGDEVESDADVTA